MAWGDEPIHAETVRRVRRPEKAKEPKDDLAAFATDPKEVLAKKPDQKVQWFAKAVELVLHGTVKVNLLYDLLSHPKFFTGFDAAFGGELRAIVDKNMNLFSAKQRQVLQSDSCKLTTFRAEDSDEDEEPAGKDQAQDTENPSEPKALGFKAVLFKKDADKAPQFSGFKSLDGKKDKDKDRASKAGGDSISHASKLSARLDAKSSAGVAESDGAEKRAPAKPALAVPVGNLNALLEMGKQSVLQAKADLQALEQKKKASSSRATGEAGGDTPRSGRGGRRGAQRSVSRSRSRGASYESGRRSRRPCRSDSRSRRPNRRSGSRSRPVAGSGGDAGRSRRPASKCPYVWRQRGIDYMKDCGLYEKRGRPEVRSRLKSAPPPHILEWMLDEGHIREDERQVMDDDL